MPSVVHWVAFTRSAQHISLNQLIIWEGLIQCTGDCWKFLFVTHWHLETVLTLGVYPAIRCPWSSLRQQAVVARKLPGGAGREWDIEQLRAGAWEGRIAEQSSVFELLNVWNVVEECRASWQGKLVQICSDNERAVFILGRGCMKNHCLHSLSLGIWKLCYQGNINLCAQYVGGDGIIAAGADGLSRDSDYGDCRLRTEVFDKLWECWQMEVDMFCSPGAT